MAVQRPSAWDAAAGDPGMGTGLTAPASSASPGLVARVDAGCLVAYSMHANKIVCLHTDTERAFVIELR